MANTLITSSMIAEEALFHLENNITVGALVHRDYKKEFVKVGDTVSIRKPVKFLPVAGATRSNQDVIEESTSIVIDKRYHVSWSFNTQDMTLKIEDFGERYLKNAMIQLANKIDQDILLEGAEAFFNTVGTAGTTPNTFEAMTSISQRLDDNSVPDDGNRCAIISPAARWGLANTLGASGSTGVFNPGIVAPMVRRGFLGDLAGLEIYGTQNVQKLTFGSRGDAAGAVGDVASGAVAVGDTTINFDGASASVAQYLRKGDVITFAGVNAVNDISKQDEGRLAEFVVTADVETTAAAGAIPIYPPVNDGSDASTAAFQNITALPAENDAISVSRTTDGPAASATVPQNLGFHKNALALVTVPLEVPQSANDAAMVDWRGYSMRVVRDYDIANDLDIIRLDVLYGVKAIYPELGVRLHG